MGREQLRFSDARDIDEFVEGLQKFERGELTPDQFRAFRLARGTYGQRQPDVSMLRVKIPQGIVHHTQLDALARIADEFSRGFGHVTTRQNLQLHFVQLARVPEAMRILDEVGLTTKEACGNTVRNITACPLAGLHADAPFDVTPYAQATTRHFLRNPICQSLPRKFKIAFSCGSSSGDCAQGAINDIGLVAQMKDGRRGFRVRVGGGLSTSPEDAHPLEEWIPVEKLLPTLEAVVRVFDRTGNRENKSRARLKYVIRKIGMDGFRAEYEKELRALPAEIPIPVEDEGAAPDAVLRRAAPPTVDAAAEGFAEWRRTNCIAQKQSGSFACIARLERGDVTAAQLRGIARLAPQFSDGTVRTTNDQNLLLRFVPEAALAALHAALVELGLGRPGARTLEDVTSCPGADTCNLAVTKSRELATAIATRLHGGVAAAVESLDIKISGCPNSCGQHHVAALGFHGTLRRVDGKTIPEYQLHLGGGIDLDGATFGRQVVKLPAKRVPEAVAQLLALYEKDKREGEAALAFFRRVDAEVVKAHLASLSEFDPATALPDEYLDHGDDQPFVVAIGAGECAA
jgi:sulfite reductase beta subunit-like hemoprotein